jgi:hypothetical protein
MAQVAAGPGYPGNVGPMRSIQFSNEESPSQIARQNPSDNTTTIINASPRESRG